MLPEHDLRRFGSHHLSVSRLIGACPGAHVENQLGITECRMDQRSQPRIRPTHQTVADSDPVVSRSHDSMLPWAGCSRSSAAGPASGDRRSRDRQVGPPG